jgi:hypothetical protein
MINRIFLITVLVSFSSVLYSQPKFDWGRQLGTKSEDFGKSIALDTWGNIFISGWTKDSLCGKHLGGYDVFIYKLDSNGKKIWSRQIGTPQDEQAQEIAVDMNGNCFITGGTKGGMEGKNKGESDIFLIKLDGDGNLLWSRQIGTEKEDDVEFLDIDASGNIFLTGSTKGTLTSENKGSKDAFILKYDTKGKLIFKKQFGDSKSDCGRGVAFDKNGNIYVCGVNGGDWGEPNPQNMDGFIAKFDNKGNLIWNKTFGTSVFDLATTLKIDKEGYIYVGGSTGGEFGGIQAGNGDAFIAKFDNSGEKLWIRQFGRNKWDGVLSVVFAKDSSEDIILSGCQNWESCEGYCRRYDNKGTLLWVEEFIPQGENGGTCGKDVAVDSKGNVYHIGGTGANLFSENLGEHDIYVVKMIDKRQPNK